MSSSSLVFLLTLLWLRASAETFSSVSLPNIEQKYVAITFDDGPHQVLTPRLLDLLKERGAKVTFYVMGVKLSLPHASATLQRALQEGHEVGNHVWDHPVLAKMPRDKVGDQLSRTSEAIKAATMQLPKTMRPPYGNTNQRLNDWISTTSGMHVIMWSLDTLDWKHPPPDEIVKRTLKKVKNGDIILMHDIHAGSIEAMPGLVDGLAKLGYKMVTVSELIGLSKGEKATSVAAAATAATTSTVAISKPKPKAAPLITTVQQSVSKVATKELPKATVSMPSAAEVAFAESLRTSVKRVGTASRASAAASTSLSAGAGAGGADGAGASAGAGAGTGAAAGAGTGARGLTHETTVTGMTITASRRRRLRESEYV